jgi:3-dehydroquinate dehydratase
VSRVRATSIVSTYLFNDKFTDQVVLRFLDSFVNKLHQILQQVADLSANILARGGVSHYSFALAAAAAVELPFVRTAFVTSRYPTSSIGTPRIP